MTKQQAQLISFGVGIALALALLLALTQCGAAAEGGPLGDAPPDAPVAVLPPAPTAWPDAHASGWPAGCAPLVRDGGIVPGAVCELPGLTPQGCL